jgi:hypothetical protein
MQGQQPQVSCKYVCFLKLGNWCSSLSYLHASSSPCTAALSLSVLLGLISLTLEISVFWFARCHRRKWGLPDCFVSIFALIKYMLQQCHHWYDHLIKFFFLLFQLCLKQFAFSMYPLYVYENVVGGFGLVCYGWIWDTLGLSVISAVYQNL